MRLLLLSALMAPLVAAADWVELRTGPFQVIAREAGDAREAANQAEQLRWVLGKRLGKEELTTIWPVRIVVFRNARQGAPQPPRLARDAYIGALAAGIALPYAWSKELIGLLLEANAARLPRGIEVGLSAFYSSIRIEGPKITLGEPPSPAERGMDWARIHLLEVSPDYYGKLRVLLYNLQRGVEQEPAYRNAFGKTPAQIDREAAAHLAAGKFDTIPGSGKPLNARRDFVPKPLDARVAAIALADLNGAYEALPAGPERSEGLALAALRDGNTAEARQQLEAATGAGSTSARAWLEQARLTADREKARAGLRKAAELNPNWAEPRFLLARSETNPAVKLSELKKATALAPRNAAYWRALAEESLAQNNYGEAAKAWAAAENASVDESERNRIRDARRNIEAQRLEWEAAERRRREEEERREIQRLKDAALAEVRAAEERANRAQTAAPANREIVPWWGDDKAPEGKLRGRLAAIECLRSLKRLVIHGEDGNTTRLLMRDPGKIVVMGTDQLAFACGPQKPARRVAVEYFQKPDAKLRSDGDVATIEYLGEPPPEGGPGPRQRLPRRN